MTQLDPLEKDYNRLTAYRFAQKYVKGRSVVDIRGEKTGYGTHPLAEIAESVTVLPHSPEALGEVSPTPNTGYGRADLHRLPCPDDSFDAAVSFEVIEHLEEPEDLAVEARRIIKQGGIFIVSTPDKQTYSNDRNYRDTTGGREMYVADFQELLERHFEHVDVFRLGSVAGSIVLAEGAISAAQVETINLSSLSFGTESPDTLFAIAVCSDSERRVRRDERPYLLLDRDRSVFEECAEFREDTELLREEIRRMQETEVQAFHDALRLRDTEIANLRDRLESSETQIRDLKLRNRRQKERIHDIESSRSWYLIHSYRRLRSRLATLIKPARPPEKR